MTVTQKESTLSRWSRRKLESKEQSSLTDDVEQTQAIPVKPESSENLVDNSQHEPVPPPLTDDDMPPLETLHADSDFSMFMSPGVSDALRNLALKKLFAAPVFNIRDGLDEYDDDFTSFEKLGDIVTCDMKHQIELEAKKKLEQEIQSESIDIETIEELEETEFLDAEDEVPENLSQETDQINLSCSLDKGGDETKEIDTSSSTPEVLTNHPLETES